MMNNNKRVTIKDIAQKSGVSIGTVHCALNGKSGVSEEKRKRIIEIAKQYDYRPNSAASMLKRKTLRIAAAFPGATEDSRYYFTFIWEGIRDWVEKSIDSNVELIECPYYRGVNDQANVLCELFNNEQIDGLLTTGYTDARSTVAVEQFIEKGIPVVLVGNDIPQSGRLCCVQPNYHIVGRTLAELIIRQIPKDSGIVLFAGDVIVPSHYLIVQGMDAYLQEKGCMNPIYKLHTSEFSSDIYSKIIREIQNRSNVAAYCAVNASNSVLLGQALKQTGKAGNVIAVGSDLFSENIQYLKDEIFTNIIYKKPYSQAYTAVRYLTDFLLKGMRPPQSAVHIDCEVIFQSNVPMYDNGSFRVLR